MQPDPPAPDDPPVVGTRHLVMLGQSEPHRMFLSAHADIGSADTVADEGALEIWWYDLNGSGLYDGARRDAITNANKVSRWAVEMSNTLAALAPGVQFKLCCLLFAGTGLGDLLQDGEAGEERFWANDRATYDLFVTDTGITQPDAAFMAWQNTDSTQLQYQLGEAWWIALTGTDMLGQPVATGATRHNVTFDHKLTELWDTSAVPFEFLMHRYDVYSGSTIDWDRFRDVRVAMDRLVASPQNGARAVPFTRGVDPIAFETGYDVGDDSHPRKTADGASKYAQQLAYNMARMTGVALVKPEIDSVTWAAAQVTLASTAGDLTTTRMLRGGALPAGQPKVAQLYFRSAGDPETLHEVPDAAIAITGGDITVDANAMLTAIAAGRGTFQRGDMLEFAPGPSGANDAQDKTDDTWLDYPGLADAVLELVPLQPVAGVITCDLGAPPVLTNALGDFAAFAATEGMPDQGDGGYIANLNDNFDSNQSNARAIDRTTLTSGIITIYADIDRVLGQDGVNSTTVNLRDPSGNGHQRVRVNDLWGEVNATDVNGNALAQGVIPLPGGRVRLWAHMPITVGGRIMYYFNNANTGGAYRNAGLYDGALPVEVIAAI
ncbi:MAG: hypothetical protein AAFZ04_01310 [Pseudomonadota bacterium]